MRALSAAPKANPGSRHEAQMKRKDYRKVTLLLGRELCQSEKVFSPVRTSNRRSCKLNSNQTLTVKSKRTLRSKVRKG